ncbi:SHD1 domain-containing protein [Verrucomicrobium spinosum]|uniref:SHD1 domain-containing protein n=1 Tax=Verrucomicrobium spinosum TaxID=2736 RepID=UPI00210BCA05|nr:SHD1 domain-containing protein [Verrucomicrobium spinosum]
MKTFRLVSLACCVLTSATLLAADNAPRVWTDNQGRKVEATFIKLENGAVYIQTAAGVIFNLPLDRLSLEDQELAKSLKPSATLMGQLPALADSARWPRLPHA